MIPSQNVKNVREALDDYLPEGFRNAQNGVRSVVYDIAEQVILHRLREEVIKETLVIHITSYFDMDEATEKLSKRLLTWTSSIARIATFSGVESIGNVGHEIQDHRSAKGTDAYYIDVWQQKRVATKQFRLQDDGIPPKWSSKCGSSHGHREQRIQGVNSVRTL